MSYFNADQISAMGGPDFTPKGEAAIRREERARIRRDLQAEMTGWSRWDPRAFREVLDRVFGHEEG